MHLVGNGSLRFLMWADHAGRGRYTARRWAAPVLTLLAAAILAIFAPAAFADSQVVADPDTKTPNFDIRKPPSGTRVQIDAENLTYDPVTKIATASGRVVISYGPYILVANHVTYDQDDDILRADGNIRLREPTGNILEADLIQLQNKFRDGFAEHLRLLLTNDATVTADYARRQDGVITIFERATYTRCKTCVFSDGTPLWQIKSRVVTHDKAEHEVRYEDMTFEFAGVPIFWLPWFSHSDGSTKRKSGFLAPKFAASDDIGLGVVIPYYWALAPNYDLTFMPLFTTDQGVMPRALWRQRTARGEYFIDAAGIRQLDADSLLPPGDRDLRGSVHSAGDFKINENWNWGWDATVASDDTFMRRYEIDEREEIVSQAHLTGLDDRNFFRARALHFDNYVVDNDNTTPIALPFIEHDFTFGQPVLGGELGVRSSVYSLNRDESFNFYPGVYQGTEQTRATTDVHWQKPMTTEGGLLATPFTRLRGDIYINDNLPDPPEINDNETASRLLPSAGMDLRWPFVRGTAAGQHVVTPVAQVVAATDETEEELIGNEDAINLNFDHTNLFLHDRFSGDDRYEGGTRVNTGLLYSYLMGNGGFLRASVGELFHVAGENSFVDGAGLEESESDLVAAIAFQPWENLRLTYQTRFDNDGFNMAVQEGTVDLDFAKFSLNGGFSDVEAAPAYGRPTDEFQAWAAATVPVRAGWSVFGGAKYDFLDDEMISRQIGIGYECDCFLFKFAYTMSRPEFDDGDLDKDHSFIMSVEFKTLGASDEDDGF